MNPLRIPSSANVAFNQRLPTCSSPIGKLKGQYSFDTDAESCVSTVLSSSSSFRSTRTFRSNSLLSSLNYSSFEVKDVLVLEEEYETSQPGLSDVSSLLSQILRRKNLSFLRTALELPAKVNKSQWAMTNLFDIMNDLVLLSHCFPRYPGCKHLISELRMEIEKMPEHEVGFMKGSSGLSQIGENVLVGLLNFLNGLVGIIATELQTASIENGRPPEGTTSQLLMHVSLRYCLLLCEYGLISPHWTYHFLADSFSSLLSK